ncbi:zinc finger RNA-binding protein [Striga asiatica]|uniref:Zinc finger RNA-binding protein n=1 Tax=Striga asiatica TaxID=4170 RepID=A0A5A7P4V8_STRAF|nr:zinc finger RNA-binding protein [Striga asiatica]
MQPMLDPIDFLALQSIRKGSPICPARINSPPRISLPIPAISSESIATVTGWWPSISTRKMRMSCDICKYFGSCDGCKIESGFNCDLRIQWIQLRKLVTDDSCFDGKPDGNVSELKGKEVTSDCSNVRFQTLPFVSYADLGVSSEIKHEKQNVKGKVDEKKSGVKRKSVSQVSSGKKPKEYWNCSICHINCTGKRPLDNHIQGRKHKVKEAALRDKKAGKNFCIGFPRKVKLWMKV